MKKLISIIFLFVCISTQAQTNRFPSVDSAKTYTLKYIRNSTVESFTNLRMQNVVYGTLELLDSLTAISGSNGIDSIWLSSSSTKDTIRYSLSGVNYTAAILDKASLRIAISDSASMLSGYTRLTRFTDSLNAVQGRINLKLNISDTTNKWLTSTYRKAGTDSVFNVKGGTHSFSFKDSIGTGSGADSSTFATQYRLDTTRNGIRTDLNGKQPTLVSGTNIKTVNSNSLLGSGDLVISGLIADTSASINNRILARFPSDTSLSINNRILAIRNSLDSIGNFEIDIVYDSLARHDAAGNVKLKSFGVTNSSTISDSKTITDTTINHTFSVIDASITNAKLANMAANTFKGAITAGAPVDLTIAQAFSQLKITDSLDVIRTSLNGKQGTLTLTTTGTSGASTLVGNTLNIPQYAAGVTTMAAIGSVPNANGATISGITLNLQPADASFGGVITTGTQTFAGAKTFNSEMVISGANAGKGPGAGNALNTRFGNSALGLNTSGTGNTFTGYQSGFNVTTGSYNTGFGLYAVPNISTTSQNTGVGAFTQFGTTTGFSNTSVGYNSLKQNQTGYENTAVGNLSMGDNTTGYQNTAIGNGSLGWNTTGIYNAAGGWQAMGGVTTGSRNSAWGAGALSVITAGNRNTAVGFLAGDFLVNTDDNTMLGANTLQETLFGNRNTVIGSYCVQLNDYPELITAIGFETLAGYKHKTDSTIALGSRIGYTGYFNDVNYRHDIIIGNFSGSNKNTGDSTLYNAIMVGNSITNDLDNIAIFGTGSQSVVLGNGGGNTTAMNASGLKAGALFYNTDSNAYCIYTTVWRILGGATIADGSITNAKLANMPANTLKGNNTGASAVPLDLTVTEATAMLNTFTSTLKGLAPSSGGGTANFLRADGTWAIPPGTPTSGTYTPTETDIANIATSTSNLATYMQVGLIVHVSGSIAITATAAATTSSIDITLPVGTVLTSTTELNGTANSDTVFGYVTGQTTDHKARITFTSPVTGSVGTIRYTFSYLVTN